MRNEVQTLGVQLAFQGGGAKIFALLAAAEAISERVVAKEIKISRISGTSAGAIVAVALGAGLNPSEVRAKLRREKLWLILIWTYLTCIFNLIVKKPFITNRYLEKLLVRILGIKEEITFSELQNQNALEPGPEIIVTFSDLAIRRQERSKPGDKVIKRIVDSCAIPFVFRMANKRADLPFFDGGITGNLPISWLDSNIGGTSDPIIAIGLEQEYAPERLQTRLGLARAILDSAIDSLVYNEVSRVGVNVIKLKTFGMSMLNFRRAQKLLSESNRVYEYLKSATADSLKHIIAAPRERYKIARFHYNTLGIGHYRKEHQLSWIIDAPYYANQHHKLWEYLNKLREGISDIVKKARLDLEVFPVSESFDAIMRPDIAYTNEALYTFPFFLSDVRTKFWDVIDYGHHRALGLLIKSETELFEKMQKFVCDLNNFSQKSSKAIHWIQELLNDIDVKHGHLYSQPGYLSNEIVPLMIHSAGSRGLHNQYLRVGSTINSTDYNDGSIFSKIEQKASMEPAVFIIDLADTPKILASAKKINDSYEVIPLLHHLTIPVGIGFSLRMFNTLDEGKLWQQLYKFSKNTLADSGTEMNNIGIELSK